MARAQAFHSTINNQHEMLLLYRYYPDVERIDIGTGSTGYLPKVINVTSSLVANISLGARSRGAWLQSSVAETATEAGRRKDATELYVRRKIS